MSKLIFGAAAFVLLAGPASAFEFDNSTCKTFLAGVWEGNASMDQGGQTVTIKTHSTYNEDGTFESVRQIEAPNMPATTQAVSGTWDAKAGPAADTCEATVTAKEFGTMSIVLKVLDENTVQGPEGNNSTRVPS